MTLPLLQKLLFISVLGCSTSFPFVDGLQKAGTGSVELSLV